MRLSDTQLEKIKQKYNVNRLWSWSRVNCFMTSPYEYYLRYIKKEQEDRQDCVYATLGTIAHECLDNYYEHEINYENMLGQFEDGWLTSIDICNLKFDRNNEEKNSAIKEKYKNNLIHFFRNHNTYKQELTIEKPVIVNINNNIFVGYIDALYFDDGFYNIIDFKTSSIYTGKTLEEHSGQLVLYAYGLSQMYNIPLDKIKIRFNFLKYVNIEYKQKNGIVKTRTVERCKIGESIQANAKMWLKEYGYTDEIDRYLKELIDTNTIEYLPEYVQKQYKISDCHVYIQLTDKLLNKWITVISDTIQDIQSRENDYKETLSDKCFWDNEESIKQQSYYFSTLCGYSTNKHKPYGEWLDKYNASLNRTDVFENIGKNNVSSKTNDVDLSWLNKI